MTDADRAKAAEIVRTSGYRVVDAVAAALAEARAPYDRLTAAVEALADELERERGSAQGNVARLLAAARLRAIVATARLRAIVATAQEGAR